MWATISNIFSPATTIKSSDVNQNFDDVKNQLNTAMPSGAIVMWSGAIVDIPSGWHLCDGNNSTPDLRNRFIVGAGDGYNPDDTGGEKTHTLSVNEMPVHTHAQNSHNHTQNPHTHTIAKDDNSIEHGGSSFDRVGGDETITSSSTTATNNATTATNQNTGGGAAHENRPPYYSLAFIMKS